jgi:hypothetical protein
MVRVYPSYELPRDDAAVIKKLGYNLHDYSFVAVGLYESGREDLWRLFGAAHHVTPKSLYADVPAL